jgi:hypothetical protein
VYYNTTNGKVAMFLYNGSFIDPSGSLPSFTINTNTLVIFYDFTGILQCDTKCSNKNYYNNSLGWIMGYKLPYIKVETTGNFASSILDLNGTKYLILSIDDYNQNHVNNCLVSITQLKHNLKMPSYYSSDFLYTCFNPKKPTTYINQLIEQLEDTEQNALLIGEKYEQDYTPTQILIPNAPRTLTQAQLYTINEINKNNNNLTNYLAKAPTSSDIIGILPVKTSVGVPTGSLLVDFSGSLQSSNRTYFGPVNIERMAIKLMDDKGNVLNLNGNDWCFTLVCESLYQY